VLALLVAAGVAQDAPPRRPPVAPDPAPPAVPVAEQVLAGQLSAPAALDLSAATWRCDGEPAEPDRVTIGGPPAGAGRDLPGGEVPSPATAVVLDFAGLGTRWSTTFTRADPANLRPVLVAQGGPDGLLIEVVLDGRRLRPAHDTWRPSVGPLRLDLGPVWLGPGEHLLEIVGREKVGRARLPVRSLELVAP
jgi:hypothetical protein